MAATSTVRTVRRRLSVVALAIGVAVPIPIVAAPTADALVSADTTTLVLQNGWTTTESLSQTRGPRISLADGIVTFRGAITGGASGQFATLPPRFRPLANVYVPVALCGGERGVLNVSPQGPAFVSGSDFAAAQCTTSLEGASYVKDPSGYSALNLQSGWTGSPLMTATPGARLRNGVVQLKGAVADGTTDSIAVLPPAMRPAKTRVIPVHLCSGVPGSVVIGTSGLVSVSAQNFALAQCYTSLEGVSFVVSGGVTALTLLNGWQTAERLADPALRVVDGRVHLIGAVSYGTTSTMFRLPVALRPTARISVVTNHCSGVPGRININPSGYVTVESAGSLTDAACATLLDGVSWNVSGFQPLALVNGWVGGPFNTATVEAGRNDGIVTLKGAVAQGGGVITTLPDALRPTHQVAVAADLCNGAVGSIVVEPDGDVFSNGDFATSQCFTSLEGVSFPSSATGFTNLTLRNAWRPLTGFAPPSAKRSDGVVWLRGAVSAGSAAQIGVLPAALRPPATVSARVPICDGRSARITIRPDGAVLVATRRFASAQCATSLDGVSFPLGSGLRRLTLRNGWRATTLGTRLPAALEVSGVVHLSGAVASGTASKITTLPPELRPARMVYAPVHLCDFTQGRLIITTSGDVLVEAGTSLAQAQCSTSLEGVRFVL